MIFNLLYRFRLVLIFLILSEGISAQNYGISSVSGTMTEKHTSFPARGFYGQKNYPVNCCGYQSGSNTVTIEKEDIALSTVTSEIGAFDYTGYTGYGSSSILVNVYMVYLNDQLDLRSNPGYVTFEGEILGVYAQKTKTVHWSSSDYASSYYPDPSVPDGRTMEPTNWNSGVYNSSWTNSSGADYFQVTNSYTTFTIGCDNGKPGDFFRVVAIAPNPCSEPNDAGSINGNESGCDSYDPTNITSISDGSGASGGTATYVWEYSTSSSSGPWTTISSSNATTYNPSSISQTTWYRRGYYHCSSSGAVYTSAIEKTVISSPNASASASSSLICSGSSITLSASIVSGASYAWRVSGNATVLSTSSTYSSSPTSNTTYELTVTKNGCSSTDNITITVESNPSSSGVIGNSQTGCGVFDPTTITSSSLPTGGSGGLTYLWEYSTSSSAGPWTNIFPSGATITALSNDCESSNGWSGTLSPDNTNNSWCIGNGSTYSTNTGPSSAYSGSNYFY